MRKTYLFVGPILFLLAYSINGYSPFNEGYVRNQNIMVELKDLNGSDTKSREEVQKSFISKLNNTIGYNYRITNKYENFSNVITLKINENDFNAIKSISLVENINTLTSYEVDYEANTFDPYGDTVVAPDKNYSRIEMNYPTNTNDGAGTIIAIIDDSFNVTHEMYKDLSNNYKYSKSAMNSIKASSGFTGTNASYKDNKIPYYFNYGNNDDNMTFNRNSDYHGSHVAGISAANNTFVGTAPNAQLALMKVTNISGSFLDTAILNALEDAVIMNVDTINMSFGTSLQDFNSDDKYTAIFKKINEKGIACNVAGGNDGKSKRVLSPSQNVTTGASETGLLGSFDYSNDVNTIAALNLTNDVTIDSSVSTASGTSIRIRDNIVNHSYVDTDGTTKDQIYDTIHPFYSLVPDGEEFTTLDYVMVPNLGNEEDYKDIDVSGKVAVIERGTITFALKIQNAISHGAKAILIYNNKEATAQVGYFAIDGIDEATLVPCAYINSSDGDLLASQDDKRLVVGKEYSASYSSDGSTADLSLKPDISSPGTKIYSGIGPDNNKYAFYNGTSMASPNFTGAVATLISDYEETSETDLFNYKKTVMNRFMSTSDPLKQTNGAYYSPRKVGSGETDLSGAINSDVYFEGNVEGKAKIELKNNDDIKNGEINLNFTAINEGTTSHKYKATVYVQAPELTGVDVTAKNINTYKFQTDKDVLLTSFTSDVTIDSGENSLTFKGEISEANKEYLTQFENGTYLEGYVIFTSLDGSEDLSIPYMGFYGDYYKQSAVEPFSFEKTEGTVYGSDLINSVALDYQVTAANFSSLWVAYDTKLTTSQKTNILNNQASYLTYGSEVLYDSDNKKVILGIDGVSSYFSIQQFVNRTVKDNDVALKNASTGEVVYQDKLKGMINKKSNLNKSLITATYLSYGYLVERAALDVSLVDENNNLLYPEGDYVLSFTYYLANGKTEVKEYNVTLTRTTPKIAPIFTGHEVLVLDGTKKYIRISFKGSMVNTVKVNGETVAFTKGDSGYYFDLAYDVYIKLDNVFITIVDLYSNTTTISLNASSIDDGAYGIISSELQLGDKVLTSADLVTSDETGDYYKYIFNLYLASGGNGNLTTEHDVFFDAKSEYVASKDTIKIYSVDSAGNIGTEQNYSLYGNTIVFKTTDSSFIVLYTEKAPVEDNTNYTPYIVIGVIGGVLIIGAVVTLVIVLKLKKKDINKPIE